MFAVLFEVHPKAELWDTYLGQARLLRPELERIDGFLDNVRYRSLTRDGWLLSLSIWRDEKALVRWRVQSLHHGAQETGRFEVFSDYHLRVGQLTRDTRLPAGQQLREQRLDETEAGAGTTATLTTATLPDLAPEPARAQPDAAAVARRLGLDTDAPGLVAWDVFEAILTPGDAILLASWRDAATAEADARRGAAPADARVRHVRVIRDYGMFDRREAPQYYPEVAPSVAAG